MKVKLALGVSLLAVLAVGALLVAGQPREPEEPLPDDPIALYARLQHDPDLLREVQAEHGLRPLAEQLVSDLEAAVEAGRFDDVVPLADPASPLGRLMERQSPERYRELQEALEVAEIRR